MIVERLQTIEVPNLVIQRVEVPKFIEKDRIIVN